MLDRDSWWPATERLRLSVGQSRRIRHECGEGPVLKVSRNADGYRAYCFRCSDSDGFREEPESLSDRIARAAAYSAADAGCSNGGAMPEPACHDLGTWPTDALVWLYRAGLGRSEIGRLGIYYHAPTDRVIVPVYDSQGPVFWQGRAYQRGRVPKYLGPTPRPPRLIARWGDAPSPTLTEDLLSAIKIGMVGEGWAVMGTKISPFMMAALMKRDAVVNVWLDPDKAGREGARKIIAQLRAYGVRYRDIVSSKDPKLHTLEQIKEMLDVPALQGQPHAEPVPYVAAR